MSPLGFLSVGCALSAAGVMVSWATRRTDAFGRPRDLPVWSVSVLVLVAVLAAYPGAQRKVQERRLARVTTVLAGVGTKVHCQSTIAALVDAGAELGWVAFGEDGVPERETLIKQEACADLEAYRSGEKSHPTEDQVIAVHVLTHEAMHMRGEANESVTECQALQRDAITAKELGATQEQAVKLARLYWKVVYPYMPPDYWSEECRPGHALDEGLASAPW